MQRPSLEELKQLSVEERLQLDGDHSLPMPKWHEEELDRRLTDIEKKGSDGVEWGDFHHELRKKYG